MQVFFLLLRLYSPILSPDSHMIKNCIWQSDKQSDERFYTPPFLILPECFLLLTFWQKSISIFQLWNKEREQGPPQRRGLAFIQTQVGIVWESRRPYSSPATQSGSNSQNKKPTIPPPPPPLSDVWHWNWNSGNKISRGVQRYFSLQP